MRAAVQPMALRVTALSMAGMALVGSMSTAHPPVNDDSTLPEGESLQTIAQVLAEARTVRPSRPAPKGPSARP